MRRFLKKFAKIAGYAFVYVLITLGTAVGVIFLSTGSGGKKGNGGDDIYIAPQLSHIYENLTLVKALDVNLEADIETPTDNIKLILDAKLDINEGLSKLGAKGAIGLVVNNESSEIYFSFTNGNLYLDMFNAKFVVETDSIGDSLGSLMGLLGVEIPDLGMDLSTLDVDMILGMLSDLEEVKSENSITLNINVPVIGKLQMNCDLKYQVNSLTLPKTEIGSGTTVALSADIKYPDKNNIVAPSNPYINATHLFNVAEAVLDYMSEDEIGFDLAVKYNDLELVGNLSANLEDFSSKFTIDILDTPLNLIAHDNVIYLEYGNVYLKFALDESGKITEMLKEQFGIEIPLEEITKILTSFKNGNFTEIIAGVSLGGGTSLSEIDLSILESFDKIGDVYTLSIRDIGTIEVGVKDKKLTSLSFNGFDAEAQLTMTKPKNLNLALSSGDYADLAQTLPMIGSLLNTLNSDNFVGTMTANVGETTLDFDFVVSKANGALRASLSANYMGQEILVDIQGETLFVQVSDLKLYSGLDDIDSIVDFIETTLGIKMATKDDFDFIETFKKVINPTINPKLITALTGNDSEFKLTLLDGLSLQANYGETFDSLSLQMNDMALSMNVEIPTEAVALPNLDTNDYTHITELLDKATETLNYVKAGAYYAEIEANYEQYKVNGIVNYDASGLSAALNTTIQDVKIEALYLDNTVYLSLADLKLQFKLEDIETVLTFVEEEFGIDLTKVINDLMGKLDNMQQGAQDFDLAKTIENLKLGFKDNTLTLTLPQLSASVNFNGNILTGATITSKELGLDLTATLSPSKIEIGKSGEYFNLTDILPFVSIVKNYIETKQFNLVADAKVYEKKTVTFATKDAQLQMDLTNGLNLYGNVVVEGKTNHALEASLFENYFYVNYNGLLIKINTNDLQEILVLVMQMMGVDPSILPFLSDVANGLDIDKDKATGLLNSLNLGFDMSNPLSMLKVVKSISKNGNTLEILLNGSMNSSNERAEYMTIQLVTDGKTLKELNLINMYTGVSNEEHFDLNLEFKEFAGVTKPDTTKNYVDISGSNELIKAALNMIDFRDFELAGNLQIDMAIPVLSDLHIAIPVNFKVKIVDGKPEVFASIEKIPVVHPLVYNLNNDTTWSYSKVNTLNVATMKSSGETRSLYIYYKDGSVYFYRTEKNSDNQTYEKKLKAPLETVMSDILYYVQWGTGFNDTIIGAIRESMANENTVDLGNIIRSFTSTSDGCTVVLNMTEITGDKNMGDMTIGLGLVDFTKTENGETSTKKIIGAIDFKMNMPFTDSIQLDMQTAANEPLRLVNVGQTIDFTDFYNFVNNYPYEDNIEMEAYSGNWTKASEREFTITFKTNSPNTVDSVKGVQGTTFTLPTFENYQVSTTTEYDLYEFAGWYTSSNFATGTEFTTGVIGRNNLTLYAKWNSLESSRTVTYYDENGALLGSQYARVGAPLQSLAELEKYEESGNQLLTKKFVGWFDEDGFRITYVPEDSVSLYAKYEVDHSLTKTKYTLTAITGVADEVAPIAVYNSFDTSLYLPNYTTDLVIGEKVYQFVGWYLDQEFTTQFDGIMPEHDLTVYAKWEEVEGNVLTIVDNGEVILNKTIVPGHEVTLPTSVKVDENTQWFLDQNFTQQTTLPEIMGEEDLTLYIRNKYDVTYTYYEKENNTHTTKTETVSLYQGETFTLPAQNNYEIDYDLDRDGHSDKLVGYFFNGYDFNGKTIYKSITISNENIKLVSNFSTQEKKYYKLTFDTSWKKAGSWTNAGDKNPDTSRQHIDEIYVLEGSYIYGTTLTKVISIINDTTENVEVKAYYNRKFLSKYYTFETAAWNTSGCKNLYKGLGLGHNSANNQIISISNHTTLYVEWKCTNNN